MSQIFRGQAIIIRIDMKESLSLVSSAKIIYKKPGVQLTGEWTATVDGTTIFYSATAGELDLSGMWILQGKIILSGERYFSDKVNMIVEEPLDG